jgi:hypothetical protein
MLLMVMVLSIAKSELEEGREAVLTFAGSVFT